MSLSRVVGPLSAHGPRTKAQLSPPHFEQWGVCPSPGAKVARHGIELACGGKTKPLNLNQFQLALRLDYGLSTLLVFSPQKNLDTRDTSRAKQDEDITA